ncbi:MAG: universal stress protein [Ilumatobacter sp.]|jgi:nucleotide-binding universal stress UspA family protein|uniref:universal stress protein n=1 Tax=Ilumatobacter sp. TaxID=1967498 RepID=UPI00391A6D30
MITIVVPLDGSPFAERAIRPACALAARLDAARIVLLTCEPDDADEAKRRLDELAGLHSSGVEIETRVVGIGQPGDVILETVSTEPEAILCMATRGRGGLGAALLGSVALGVVRKSTRPLILVGPRCGTALLPSERGRLLVCSDGSEFSNSILPIADTWSELLDLRPWLTEVVGPDENPEPSYRPVPNREIEAAKQRLGVLSTRFVSSTDEPGIEVLHGTPGHSIAEFAERLPAALIAIASHGRTGLTRLTMGSVATEIVRHAPCPVLISRPSDN